MKKTTWQSPYSFEPERYQRELTSIIAEIEACQDLDHATLHRILGRHPKGGKEFFSKSEIIRGFRFLVKRDRLNGVLDSSFGDRFVEKLRMKPVRTASGVTPVTLLTPPFPCPGRCIFCPSDVRMPKSYLSREPGAQRAAQHAFDPYEQTLSRLRALDRMGHPVDKVELIVLGGTWSFYPEGYRYWFIQCAFEAMNDFGTKAVRSRRSEPGVGFPVPPEPINGKTRRTYNDAVSELRRGRGGWAEQLERGTLSELEEAHQRNEIGTVRCVGLSLETRPDYVSEAEVIRLRQVGATKIQIGIQSLSDDVLALNRRGHDVATTRRAVRRLRHAGFKIQAHWMPNLYGATPEGDIADFDRLFSDADFCPDELKIYPCSLIESAELMVDYEAGRWRPYSQDELLEVLVECLNRVPEYCRVSRVIRDIPGDDIVAGNKATNFRSLAEAELEARGGRSLDIRSREIRGAPVRREDLRLKTISYRVSTGTELFLQFVTGANRIAAFLRLSLPAEPSFIEEIETSAMIREVHVYGTAVGLGRRDRTKVQHLGLGRRLIHRAGEIAADRAFTDLAVISSVGTRAYYRGLGFEDGRLYQHRRRPPGGLRRPR